jgi:murein DD-endopeptidase MepM/ murein hydrolase activator NlpD
MSIKFRLFLPFLALPLLAAAPAPAPQPAPAPAAAPQFMIPAACTPGRDCWIVHYVDTATAPDDFADYQCGTQTYDKHDAVDFAVRDWKAMEEGVDVLAAAGGKILRVRDGIEDKMPAEGEADKMLAENRGCGNGVVVDHGDGWQTIYCHLKRGSISVRPDDTVSAGQRIAGVGHSGAAEFPHLHFGVFKDGKTIDPFTGNTMDKDCRAPQKSMWMPGLAMPYEPIALYAAGFDDSAPDYESLLRVARNPDTLPVDAPALTFWVLMYGALEGDQVVMKLYAPDGTTLAERTLTQEEKRARQYYYLGKRNDGKLAVGPYTGTLTLTRTLADGRTVTRSIGRSIYIQ